MATRSTNRIELDPVRSTRSTGNGSAFRWGSAGAIAGAALGGAALAFAANLGRKFATQGIQRGQGQLGRQPGRRA